MSTKLNAKYELEHWKIKREKNFSRSLLMKNMFDIPDDLKTAADVGCGPICGIFTALSFDKMYAIDILWKQYIQERLQYIPPNVVTVFSDAETFKLPEKVDIIFSFNSLDHSGDLRKSIQNILSNLKKGGLFCLHVNLRNKKQLNSGHRMIVTEAILDNILKPYNLVNKKVVKDPFMPELSKKNYLAYITTISK